MLEIVLAVDMLIVSLELGSSVVLEKRLLDAEPREVLERLDIGGMLLEVLLVEIDSEDITED